MYNEHLTHSLTQFRQNRVVHQSSNNLDYSDRGY